MYIIIYYYIHPTPKLVLLQVMPLFSGGRNLPTFQDLTQDKDVISSCQNFLSAEIIKLQLSQRYLYVLQGEAAIVNLDSCSIEFLGSGEATTCHIVAFKDSNHASITHLDDGVKSVECVSKILCQFGSEVDIFIIGGFTDERNISLEITNKLFECFHNHEKTINVRLWCTVDQNTLTETVPASPICCSAALDLKSGEFFHTEFGHQQRGPELPLRSTLYSHLEEVHFIFSTERDRIVIPYFEFVEDPSFLRLVNLPDSIILEHCSTSPHCEPTHFGNDVRERFLFTALQNSKKVFGPSKQKLVFKMDDSGAWVKEI